MCRCRWSSIRLRLDGDILAVSRSSIAGEGWLCKSPTRSLLLGDPSCGELAIWDSRVLVGYASVRARFSSGGVFGLIRSSFADLRSSLKSLPKRPSYSDGPSSFGCAGAGAHRDCSLARAALRVSPVRPAWRAASSMRARKTLAHWSVATYMLEWRLQCAEPCFWRRCSA